MISLYICIIKRDSWWAISWSVRLNCEVLKLADMPSCLEGRDNTINERYGLTTQFRSPEFAFWLSALWRFESFSHSLQSPWCDGVKGFFCVGYSVVVRKIVSEILPKFEPFSNGRFIDNYFGREWWNSIIFLKWINPLERASYHYSPLFKSWAIIVQRMMQPF